MAHNRKYCSSMVLEKNVLWAEKVGYDDISGRTNVHPLMWNTLKPRRKADTPKKG